MESRPRRKRTARRMMATRADVEFVTERWHTSVVLRKGDCWKAGSVEISIEDGDTQ